MFPEPSPQPALTVEAGRGLGMLGTLALWPWSTPVMSFLRALSSLGCHGMPWDATAFPSPPLGGHPPQFQEAIESRGAKNMQLPGQIKDVDDEDDDASFADMKAGGEAVNCHEVC